jgi:hypothetical protein
MPKIEMPNFLDAPTKVWVKCESFTALPANEVICEVQRVYGGTGLVITGSKFFEDNGSGPRVRGALVGVVMGGEGKLVDFPSGERIAVPADKVDALHGSAV